MKSAIRIAGLYAVLSGLYIVSSDWAAYQFAQHDPQMLSEWQSFKGIMFVAASSLIIFLLVFYFERGWSRARLQVESALDSFQQLFDSNPLPSWVYDTVSLRCLAVNEATLQEYGYTREEFLRLNMVALHPSENVEKFLSFIALVKTRPRTSQWSHLRHDGSRIEMEIISQPIQFEGKEARLVVAQNVTARKVTERALADAVIAKSEAQCAKSRFLASISHEMRTPLHTIMGYFHLIVGEEDARQRQEYGQIIQKGGKELVVMIDRMVQAAELQTHLAAPKAREVELRQFLETEVAACQSEALRAGIAVVVEVHDSLPRHAILDGDRLQEVIRILLENAVKFSPAGTVTLRGRGQFPANGEGELEVSVADQGIGVRAEKQAEIFELFTQAENDLNRHYGGAGLGLFVARQLCGLMGATLTLTSAAGQGSCFTIHMSGQLESNGRFVASKN